MTYVIGVVDTTFSRVDMGRYAIRVIREELPGSRVVRYTVPGVKDLPLATLKILERTNAALALGWVGPSEIDKQSYLVASIGLLLVQLITGKPVLTVTVHEDEASDARLLCEIAIDRTVKHAKNLVVLLTRGYEALTRFAGAGLRQGAPDVGPLTGCGDE